MENKKSNEKEANQKSKESKNIFNNCLLSKLNLKDLTNNPQYITESDAERNVKNILKTNSNNKNYFKKDINEYSNNPINKDNHTQTSTRNINSSKYLIKKKNLKILYRKYLLGNDVILPLKTVNDVESSKIPYYLYDNSKNITLFSPTKNKLKMSSKSLLHKSYKTYYTTQSSKKTVKKRSQEKYKKNIFLNFKDSNYSSINSDKNRDNKKFNLYSSINLNNYSKNDLIFKSNKNFNINKSQFIKNISQNTNSNKEINLFFPIERSISSSKRNIYNNTNYKRFNYQINNKNNKNEINKCKDIDEKKKRYSYNKIKNLFDEPCSLINLMFNKMKNSKMTEMENQKKLNLREKILEYKKELNKLEQRARIQIFNLRKQVAIGHEDMIKGKIISTNTFFDLAFGGY